MTDNKVPADGDNNISLDNNVQDVGGNNIQAQLGNKTPQGNNAVPANPVPFHPLVVTSI